MIRLLIILMTLASGCSQERPPNVIYILADDLGYGELESYGQTLIKTPHLSALASQGIQFTQHYTLNIHDD